MDAEQIRKITDFVANNIGDFHQNRVRKLREVKLNNLLRRCNPYLCKAKHLEVASDFIRALLRNHLTHGEQTLFGGFLEELAIFTGDEIFGATKSGIEGIDLEFSRGDTHYLVSVKSGPNWGNSSAIKKQTDLFVRAARTIRQSKSAKHARPVLGCCFGRTSNTDRGSYDHYCGQKFWDFLSGDECLYLDIVEPLGHDAFKHNEHFESERAKFLNLMTEEFTRRFCSDGKIDWNALVEFNSKHKQ